MAETWEIVLWVIVAAAIVIIIAIIIASIFYCRKRNRRKKNVKHQRFEWERKDETDNVKLKVFYDPSTGEAKILDQTDSGEKSSKVTQVEYNAKTEEARILGVGDNKGFVEEKTVDNDSKNSDDERQKVKISNKMSNSLSASKESQSFSESYKSKSTEVKHTSADNNSKGDYVRLQAAPVQRERLHPLEMFPRETPVTSSTKTENATSRVTSENMTSRMTSGNLMPQGAVKSYTNFGYSQTGQNIGAMPNVRFQQPVAVVKAFVNPGRNAGWRQARTLPRNYSRLNYKKSFTTSTTPRRKPLLCTWSLKANDSETPLSWINLPIVYKEMHPYADRRRRSTKHRSLTRSRSFTKRSLRRQSERKLDSLHGVYITDSRPQRLYKHNSTYGRSLRPNESYRAPEKSKPTSDLSTSSKVDRRNYGDFYEERYKMVKKSEFPAFRSSSSQYEAKKSRDIEPEISSIVSGSEFSDFLPTPPRPSESPSDGSTEGYSRGSYKAYKSRLEKSCKGIKEESSHDTSQQHRAAHFKSFEETLQSLRNGDRKDQYSTQHEVTSTNEAASPWINNDSRFRKQHGVPITGVPVLPPEPVFIQVEDSDESNYQSRSKADTD